MVHGSKTMTEFQLPGEVRYVLDTLHAAGHKAYIVGGCVRDHVMGRVPHDYDITTSATPEEVHAAFPEDTVVDTGKQFGTVTVVVRPGILEGVEAPFACEVTTFRRESNYSDARHPDHVQFVDSLREDLSRRDFTMNAMAYSEDGIVELFGGVRDIQDRIIRTVGDPMERFYEDPLRILRGLRFVSTYGFHLSRETRRAAFEMAGQLEGVSRERITRELTRMLMGKYVRQVLMDYTDILTAVLPELAPMARQKQLHPFHRYDLLEHTAAVVESLRVKTPALVWAGLLHDCGKPFVCAVGEDGRTSFHGHPEESVRVASEILENRIRLSNADAELVKFLVGHHHRLPTPDFRSVRRFVARYGRDALSDLLILARADAEGFSDYGRDRTLLTLEQLEDVFFRLDMDPVPTQMAKLAVNGNDVMACGVPEGPEVGTVLQQLFDRVLDGELPNDRETLLKALREMLRGREPKKGGETG